MRTDPIAFISAYCDSWCERCAFTARCSAFAATCAIATCGDVREGVELAPGRPTAEPGPQPSEPPASLADLAAAEATDEDMERFRREKDARNARLDNTAMMKLASAYTMLASRWLRAEHDAWGPSADPVLREAMRVISWDHILIRVKLQRALNSREQSLTDEHPIQNDANGSAKLALILIERSQGSWHVVARATGGEVPLMMADHLAQLGGEVDAAFPEARRFVRPGFDEEPPRD